MGGYKLGYARMTWANSNDLGNIGAFIIVTYTILGALIIILVQYTPIIRPYITRLVLSSKLSLLNQRLGFRGSGVYGV